MSHFPNANKAKKFRVQSAFRLIFARMNVLIIDRFPTNFLEALRAMPINVNYLPEAKRAEILTVIPEAEILILNSKIKVDREVVEVAKNLKMVVRAGVGLDHIDAELLAESGIRLENTVGANADAVGEQTVGMLLGLRHNIVRADRQVKNFEWKREENRGVELGGKTVGIIGYGNTGKAVAKRLAGFDCEILAFDKYVHGFEDGIVKEVELKDIFERADVCSLHIPLSDETRGWVNDDFFNQFVKPIYFLNLARGPILHLPALLKALDEGLVIGAGLDVLVNEKLHRLTPEQRGWYEQLFAHDRVIVTPHVGGWTVESLENVNNQILDYVREVVNA